MLDRIAYEASDVATNVSGENINSNTSSIEQTTNRFHVLPSSEETVQANISTAKIDKSK